MKIQPAKGLIPFIITLALSVFPALLVNTVYGYLPLLGLLCAGVVSCLQLIFVRRGLVVDTTSDAGMRRRGESSAFQLKIENRTMLPVPDFSAKFFVRSEDGNDMHAYPLHITMSPRESRGFDLEADLSHIGIYEAGLEEVRLYDLFHLFKVDCPVFGLSRVEVVPESYYLQKLPISDQTMSESAQAVTASVLNGMDYTGVREYAFGDPMKRIQWKLSAHSNTLMTKLMESYTNVGMTIVMDLRKADAEDRETQLSLHDAVIECAAAIASFAHRNGLDFDLLYRSDLGRFRQHPISAEEFLLFLPSIHMHEQKEAYSPAQILREDCTRANAQNNIVLCTAVMDEETATLLVSLRQRGKNPILVYLLPGLLSDRERSDRMRDIRLLQYANISVIVAESAEGMVMRA